MSSFFRTFLLPFSWLFGLGVWAKDFLYDLKILKSQNAGIPVIAIGNLSTGGTGKTPMAIFLLATLIEMGYRPAYLSRGYGRKTKGYQNVNAQTANSETVGEEALMIASRFPNVPVAVCEDRILGAKRLVETNDIQVLILDDAFQHRKIYRDLDIVMLDVENLTPFLLPAGNGRESLRTLYRADIILGNRWKDKKTLPAIRSKIEPYLAKDSILGFCKPIISIGIQAKTKQKVILSDFSEVVLFSGIGNNLYFEQQIREKGVNISVAFHFADHHLYTISEVQAMIDAMKEQKAEGILTTEKDYYRLINHPELENLIADFLYYVPMQWEWESGKTALIKKVTAIMQIT